MDENDWKLISVLYRTKSISQAASLLFTTQPTLSKKLKQIEKDFNVQLVVRTSKGVIFTPEGKYLAEEAEKILYHFQTIHDTILQITSGNAGVLRLGMTNTFARFTMAPFINLYRSIYTHVNFEMLTGNSAHVIDLCESGQIHVSFIRGESQGHFEKFFIKSDQAVLVSKTQIALQDLPSMPQICYITDPFSKKLLDQWWHEWFQTPPMIGLQVNHGDTCREMIMNGLGYGIFLSPEFFANEPSLFQMPLFYKDGTPLTRNSWMIWRKESEATPLVQNFINYIKENSLYSET